MIEIAISPTFVFINIPASNAKRIFLLRMPALSPTLPAELDFRLDTQLRSLHKHGVLDWFGREECVRQECHLSGAGRRPGKGGAKIDEFQGTRPVPQTVQPRPRFAPGSSRPGGFLRVLSIGSQQSRSESGRLAQRHDGTNCRTPPLYTITTLSSSQMSKS